MEVGMSAALLPLRSGAAEAFTPRSELTAHGTTRFGPPRPEPAPLSPARAALASHQADLARLAAEADRLGQPVERLRKQLDAAEAEQHKAGVEIEAIDASYAAALAHAAREGEEAPEPFHSPDAAAALDRARRNVNSIRQALDECQRDQIKAGAELEAARSRFPDLLLAVLRDQHALLVDDWAGKRDAHYLAEGRLRGLHNCIAAAARELQDKTPGGAGLPWFRALEQMQPPYYTRGGHVEIPGPKEIAAAADRWATVIERLKADPGATFD
jgi:hypothetical protein